MQQVNEANYADVSVFPRNSGFWPSFSRRAHIRIA
jgi:hypothetical protein